jgi:hypothetical protein
MWRVKAKFDPVTGVRLAAKLESTVEAVFSEAEPPTCPSDPIEKQGYLRARALSRLIENGDELSHRLAASNTSLGSIGSPRSGTSRPRSDRPEFVVVIDVSINRSTRKDHSTDPRTNDNLAHAGAPKDQRIWHQRTHHRASHRRRAALNERSLRHLANSGRSSQQRARRPTERRPLSVAPHHVVATQWTNRPGQPHTSSIPPISECPAAPANQLRAAKPEGRRRNPTEAPPRAGVRMHVDETSGEISITLSHDPP